MALPGGVSVDSIRAVYEAIIAGAPMQGQDGSTPASTSNPVPTKDTNGGVKIDAATMPTGGTGFLGWLSAIWYAITNRQDGVYLSTLGTLANAARGDPALDVSGNLRSRIVGGSSTGLDGTSNTLAFVGSSSSQISQLLLGIAGYVFNGTTWDRLRKANIFTRLLTAAASDNATVVKASAGDLCRIYGVNAAATKRYLKIYNKATTPTSSDTPVLTLELAALAPFTYSPDSAYFSAGLSFRITTGQPDNDVGSLTAGDITSLNILAA